MIRRRTALLEAGAFRWDALSGSSAGALNAIVMADGLARGQARGGTDPRAANEAAREALTGERLAEACGLRPFRARLFALGLRIAHARAEDCAGRARELV